MLTTYFSTGIWINATSIIGLLYALYIMSCSNKKLLRGTDNNVIPLFFIILVTFYIGLRPIWCYADTYLYTLMFNLTQSGEWLALKNNAEEPFFTFIEYLCIEFTDASGWLLVIAIFYVVGMGIAAYRWMPRHLFLAIIFCFTAFSFFTYGTNGIRNGMASSIALVGLSFFCKGNIRMLIGYGLLFLGMTTHKVIGVVIVAATVAMFLKRTGINLSIWLLCIILGLLFQDYFKDMFTWLADDDRMTDYLTQEVSDDVFSKTGFRWDFIIYSAAPILLGWYTIVKKGVTDKTYMFLLHTYIFANAFWILINTVAYSNRFAYASWFMYPILLAYPLAKFNIFKHQGPVTGLILIASVAFTYIMQQ